MVNQIEMPKNLIEITDDPLTAFVIVDELVKALRGPMGKPASRELALAVTKLQEAGFWLNEQLKNQVINSK